MNARALLFCGALAWSHTVVGADGHATHAMGGKTPAEQLTAWQQSLQRPPLAASGYFDAHGVLWLARVRAGHLTLARSTDRGRTYSDEVVVNPEADAIAADGENRPKIAGDAHGNLYVSYTQLTPGALYSGNVRFSRSTDGGKTFSPPITVNDDHALISHRFEALGVTAAGDVYLAWLDKRDQAEAQRRGAAYAGAALYYTVSKDAGASFAPNRKLADHSCECCRVVLALDRDDVPVVLWRHVYDGNERDHALARLDGQSAPRRATHDHWAIDACPHHGPALAVATDGTYHLAWFEGGGVRRGLFYARSHDRGRHYSPPLAFGRDDTQASHPSVLTQGQSVYLAWKALDTDATTIQVMVSRDGGVHWTTPLARAATHGAADHPFLISDGNQVYLSWNTQQEGYRLLRVDTMEDAD